MEGMVFELSIMVVTDSVFMIVGASHVVSFKLSEVSGLPRIHMQDHARQSLRIGWAKQPNEM